MDSELPKEVMTSESSNYSFQDYSASALQINLMEPISNDLHSQSLFLSNMPMRHVEGLQKFLIPSQPRGMDYMPINMGLQKSSLPVKRKAPVDVLPTASKQSSIFSKNNTEMEHRPWLHQVSQPNKRFLQLLSLPPGPVVPQSRRTQRPSAPKNRAIITNNFPKLQNEPSESVRSKMRESLSAALALVSQKVDNTLNDVKNSQPGNGKKSVELQDNVNTASVEVDPDGNIPGQAKEVLFSKEESSLSKIKDENTSQKVFESLSETLGYDRLQFQTGNILPYEGLSFGDNFFSKDELLQGNGLSWAMDSDLQMAERNEIHFAGKQNLKFEEVEEKIKVQSPRTLAMKVEAELFNLYGGVNKKYKEKGRSLLFNLKDPNNPELRERVMSGAIPPERLCSMTVEELASKELSEWRVAKAEELAQMVVLPESEVDIRRLVRKTHKGEFQVEVEQSDNVPIEVSAGASAFAESESNNNGTEGPSLVKDELSTVGVKNNPEDKDVPYELTLQPNEGTDLMQGLMVDDSLKDADFLPPIISLDEFMLSLQSEPPFETLSSAAKKSGDIELGSESKSSSLLPKYPANTATEKNKKTDEIHVESDAEVKPVDDHSDLRSNDNRAGANPAVGDSDFRSSGNDTDLKIGDNSVKSDSPSVVNMSKAEHFWRGSLQLNTFSTISIAGVFKGGEKKNATEWPGSLEIKGRVRLDAFEKFVRGLPLSRSRAFMVVHFDLKEASSEKERASLGEVVDSYVSDQRVGFAEVSSGVEIYFCPPRKTSLEMLNKHLPSKHVESLDSIHTGLIGVVVWKKAQSTSTISPNSSSLHKHTSRRQHSHSRKQQVDSPKHRIPPHSSSHPPPTRTQLEVNDDDGDLPPGFGPGPAGEDDDLPEFNFSAPVPKFTTQTSSTQRPSVSAFHPMSPTSSRPVEKIRELINKYGHSESNESSGRWQDKRVVGSLAVQPLNHDEDDDDDDIPEWQAPQYNKVQGAQPLHAIEQQRLRAAAQQLLPPASGQHQGQGSQWPPQFYGAESGMTWPRNAPQSRGP